MAAPWDATKEDARERERGWGGGGLNRTFCFSQRTSWTMNATARQAVSQSTAHRVLPPGEGGWGSGDGGVLCQCEESTILNKERKGEKNALREAPPQPSPPPTHCLPACLLGQTESLRTTESFFSSVLTNQRRYWQPTAGLILFDFGGRGGVKRADPSTGVLPV